MREALVMMDLLAVLVLLALRETVVSLVPMDLLDLSVLLDPMDHQALLGDPETVVNLDLLDLLALLDLLEPEVHLALLDLVVRKVLLEKKEKGA